MNIVLPTKLDVNQCMNPLLKIQLNPDHNVVCTNPMTKEEFDKILLSQRPVTTYQYAPPWFVRVFLLIKLNSLSKAEANVPTKFLNQLIKLFNQSHFHEIWASRNEEELFSQIISHLEEQCQLSARDMENILEGTATFAAISCWMISEVKRFMKKTQISFTLSFTALGGRSKAFTPIVHRQKNHIGQMEFAQKMYEYTCLSEDHTSGIPELKVQDPYSMRCTPHVHGVAYDSIFNLEKELGSLINRLHCKFLTLKGKVYPNLLVQSDTFSLKLDYVILAMQELGAMSFLRSERILNSYLGKNKISHQSREYCSLHAMMKSGINSASKNKILSQMGNFDTMNIDNFNEDVFFTTGDYFQKCEDLMNNLYYLLTLEILSSIEGIKSLFKEKVQLIFKHPEITKNFKFLLKETSAIDKRNSLSVIQKIWMANETFI